MDKKRQKFLIKRYQLEHLVPLGVLIISVFFWIYYFEQTFLKILGLIVNLLGLFVWWSAKLTLGKNWSVGYGKPELKTLVTSGIYSKISHPLYWGINLTLIGLALLYQKTWFVIIDLLIVFYFFRRMSVEDKFLTRKLGKRYTDYRKSTWI